MHFIEIMALAVGLSMDAFAVSLCKGLTLPAPKGWHYLCIGLWFGGFQMLMPFLGYRVGSAFEPYIKAYDHWVIFALLCFIGGQMIVESRSKEEAEYNGSFGVKAMLPLAVATSLDALAVGISLALIGDVNLIATLGTIGITTFGLSGIGLYLGAKVGSKYKAKAELFGGIILILIGIKILISHLTG